MDKPAGASSDDLAYASLTALGRRLRAGQTTAVELAEMFLARLERYGPELNAVATLTPERGLAEAKQADVELAAGHDRGPLHGIPYGAKDLLAAAGAPTTWGAAPFRRQYFERDATVIAKLREAGAVLVAKLAMVELAGAMGYNHADASLTGACRTPWNTDYWSGGSSSGSGAAVAAGLVPFAIGSETDGSITNPASYCGVTGLRPTYGRVSRAGAMVLSWTLDKLGPLCRSAADAGLVLSAIAGRDPADITTVDVPLAQAPVKRWRVATVAGTHAKLQPEVAENFERSLHTLRDFCTLTSVRLPEYPYDAMVSAVIAAEAASSFRDIINDGRVKQLRDPGGRAGAYAYLAVSAVDYVDAMRRRAQLRADFARLFETADVLVAPTFSTVALPVALPFDKAYPGTDDGELVTACNLAGLPAISVPNGFGRHGLPTGLMFVAPPFAESELVAIAATYQSRTAYHLARPPRFA
jgi:aspartyl-tRNA(Asn)/glutamyl-tRNA(Gln) amidotransferase subunit A